MIRSGELRTSFVRLDGRAALQFGGIGRGSAGLYLGVDADNHSSHAVERGAVAAVQG